jgi:hypothetical protein
MYIYINWSIAAAGRCRPTARLLAMADSASTTSAIMHISITWQLDLRFVLSAVPAAWVIGGGWGCLPLRGVIRARGRCGRVSEQHMAPSLKLYFHCPHVTTRHPTRYVIIMLLNSTSCILCQNTCCSNFVCVGRYGRGRQRRSI